MKKSQILSMVVFFTLVLFAVACGKKKTEVPQDQQAAAAVDGETIYLSVLACNSCHGDKGLGDGVAGASLEVKPRNFTDTFKYGSDLESVKKTIANGVEGTGMAPYKDSLTPEELDAVAKYVLKLAGKEVK